MYARKNSKIWALKDDRPIYICPYFCLFLPKAPKKAHPILQANPAWISRHSGHAGLYNRLSHVLHLSKMLPDGIKEDPVFPSSFLKRQNLRQANPGHKQSRSDRSAVCAVWGSDHGNLLSTQMKISKQTPFSCLEHPFARQKSPFKKDTGRCHEQDDISSLDTYGTPQLNTLRPFS